MKTSIKKMIALATVAILITATPVVFAQPSCEGGGPGGEIKGPHKGRMFEGLSEKLGLTPEQETQLKEHKQKTREEMDALKKELFAKGKQLHEELGKPDSDKTRIDGIVAEMKALESKQIDQRVNNFLEMKKILTPEQFEKFMALKEEGKQRWQEKRDRGWKQPGGRYGHR